MSLFAITFGDLCGIQCLHRTNEYMFWLIGQYWFVLV